MFRSGVSSRAAVQKLSLNRKRSEGATKNDTFAVRKDRAIFNAFRNSTTSSCAPSSLSDGSFSDYIDHLSRHAMAHSSPCSTIVIYQTLHAFTGGTTAMRLLYEALLQIGYVDAMDLNSSSSKCAPNVILCNDSSIASSERLFLACTEPKGDTLVSHPAWVRNDHHIPLSTIQIKILRWQASGATRCWQRTCPSETLPSASQDEGCSTSSASTMQEIDAGVALGVPFWSQYINIYICVGKGLDFRGR